MSKYFVYKYMENVIAMFGIMFKLGTNTAISSRGDSSKFTLLKKLYVTFYACYFPQNRQNDKKSYNTYF